MIRMKEYTKPAFHLFLKEQYWHYLRLTDARTAAAYHLDSIWPPGHWIVTAIIHVWYLDYRTICRGLNKKKVKKEHMNKHSIYTRILIPYVWFSHMFTWQVKSCKLPFSRCLIIATFHGDVPRFWCWNSWCLFPGATSADGDLGRALHAPRASALACPFDQSPAVLTTGWGLVHPGNWTTVTLIYPIYGLGKVTK